METIEFKIEYIDIVHLLKSAIALGVYRGREVWTELEKLVDSISEGTLVLIDLRKVLWISTSFYQPAFGPLFKSLGNHKWPRKYIIFQMYDIDNQGFFQGIMKYFKIDVPRKESESKFISANMYAKLIIGNKKSINFVGKLNKSEQNILNVVNNLRQTTAKQVVEKSELRMEIVVDTLRSLVQKYFIMEYSNDSDKECYYYSFYNYLWKE